MTPVELEYQKRIDEMPIHERVRRAAEMYRWARDFLARQIRSENAGISDERLKWEVALRQYGAEKCARELIEGILARVSD